MRDFAGGFASTSIARRSVMPSSKFVVVLAAMAVFPAAASAQGTVRVDARAVAPGEGELAALRHEYAVTASAGDARGLTALYAEDAIAVPREGVVLRGPAEIQRYFAEAFASAPQGATVTLTPRHFSSYGRVASETGTFAESHSPEGEPLATGVYVAIYTRGSDGAWRISMEVRTTGRDKQTVKW
jgi:uncharacterized protein (TIGR02246 family)